MQWQFPLQVVKQNIKQHGTAYTFQRYKKDSRGQETSELEEVGKLSALFHISKGYVTKTIGDSGFTRAKGQPMLLCVTEDADFIQVKDIVIVKSFLYRVTEKNDLNQEGMITDISLELMDNGR